jgi:glucose/mannose transport system substrate-binding protein
MSSKPLVCFPLFLLFQMTAHPVDAAPKAALEIFSYWTSGSEAAALNALLDVYKAQNPGVEIVNATVAGGNGSAALPVLQARLLGGNPPTLGKPIQGRSYLIDMSRPGNANQ